MIMLLTVHAFNESTLRTHILLTWLSQIDHTQDLFLNDQPPHIPSGDSIKEIEKICSPLSAVFKLHISVLGIEPPMCIQTDASYCHLLLALKNPADILYIDALHP